MKLCHDTAVRYITTRQT